MSTRPIRHRIERLSPYQSLALLAVPIGFIEPLKLVAVAIAGEGHWRAVMIAVAYLGSLFVVERLFAEAVDASVVREALGKFLSIREKVFGRFKRHWRV